MLVLFGGHGHPVTLIVACSVALLAPSLTAWLWWRRLRVACAGSPDALAAVRREVRFSIGAAAILTAVFALVSYVALWGSYVGVFGVSLSAGHVVASLPLLALSLVLLLHTAGERAWPLPTGRRRDAGLVAREPAAFADRREIAWWLGTLAAVVLGVALAASGARAVSKVQGHTAETIAPYPGWLWAVPILCAAGFAALLLQRAVRAVADRPVVPDVSTEWDAWLRHQVARRLVRTAVLLFGFTAAGVLTVAGSSIHLLGRGFGTSGEAGTPSGLYQVAGIALQILGAVIAVVALWSASRPVPSVAPDPLEHAQAITSNAS